MGLLPQLQKGVLKTPPSKLWGDGKTMTTQPDVLSRFAPDDRLYLIAIVREEMKILITSTGSWGTGSFTIIFALVKEFQRAGHHEIKVIFPDSGYPAPPPASYLSNPELWNIWQFPIEGNGVKLETFPLMIADPHP